MKIQYILNNNEARVEFIKLIQAHRAQAGFADAPEMLRTDKDTTITLQDPNSKTKIVIELPKNPDPSAKLTASVTIAGNTNTDEAKINAFIKTIRSHFPDAPISTKGGALAFGPEVFVKPQPMPPPNKRPTIPAPNPIVENNEKYVLKNSAARTEFIKALQPELERAGFTQNTETIRNDVLTKLTLKDPKTGAEIRIELPKNPSDANAQLVANVTVVGNANSNQGSRLFKVMREKFPDMPLSVKGSANILANNSRLKPQPPPRQDDALKSPSAPGQVRGWKRAEDNRQSKVSQDLSNDSRLDSQKSPTIGRYGK